MKCDLVSVYACLCMYVYLPFCNTSAIFRERAFTIFTPMLRYIRLNVEMVHAVYGNLFINAVMGQIELGQ